MGRTLTESEIELLEKLKSDQELGGRGLLRRFIIRNSYQPKYKVGDYVKVSDSGLSIWGNRAIDVNAKIIEVSWWLDKGEECVQYECVAYDQFGNDHTMFAEESIYGNYEKRHITGYSDTDQNTFEKLSKYSDSSSF